MNKYIKFLWKYYIYAASILGTFVGLYILISLFYIKFSEPFNKFPYRLQNGLLYSYDMQDGGKNSFNITDNGQILVYSDVVEFLEYQDFVYGYRKDLSGNGFFFICKKDESCSDNQHMKDNEFRLEVEKLQLPSFYRGTEGKINRNNMP